MKLSRQSNEYEGIPRVEGAATFTNEYRMVGLRQEGRDHKIKRQKPCQDNFSFGRSGRFIWMAVADGVGSESHSQFGARLACDSIAPFLYGQQDTILDERNGLNPEDFSQAIIENARNELIRFSEETDLDIRALSSTLQVVIFDLDVDRITYASIGDGNCIATNSNIGNYVVGHKRPSPMSGTPNLGSHDCLKYIYSESIGCIQDTDQVLLFSDGLDRMFIIPREPGSRQAVGEKPVKYITRILEISENELQALDRIGKFFNVEDYEELIRDDLTLMAIKNINLSSSPVKQLLPADNDKNEDYFGINKSNLESN
ncbi:MAG: protein phosphatase 2C domain-containing protein, partial [Lentilitoribacter sp.]